MGKHRLRGRTKLMTHYDDLLHDEKYLYGYDFVSHKVLITPKAKAWRKILGNYPELYTSLWDLIPPTLESTIKTYNLKNEYDITYRLSDMFSVKYKDIPIGFFDYDIEYTFRIEQWWKHYRQPEVIKLMLFKYKPEEHFEIFFTRLIDAYGDLAEYDENYRKRNY